MRALIGAQGTGKTTLLRALNKKHPQITVSDGSSRPMKAIRKALGLSFMDYQRANNIFATHRYKDNIDQPNYFTTRTLVDNWVYCKLAGYGFMAEEMEKEFLALDFKSIEYFYLPIEFGIEDDGVRSPDMKFQYQVDDKIKEFFIKHGLKKHILTGSVEERIKQLENYLEL